MRDARDVAHAIAYPFPPTMLAVEPETVLDHGAALVRADRRCVVEECKRLLKEVSYPDDWDDLIVRLEDAYKHIDQIVKETP